MLRSAESIVFHLIHDAYHAIKDDGVNRCAAELLQSQWWNAAEIEIAQRTKLADLLIHARQHVPYYRALLPQEPISPENAKETLQSLPPLTKDIIRSQLCKLCSNSASNHTLEANSTSGSTGEPLKFYTDVRSGNRRKAAVIRNKLWAGCPLGGREARLWGSPVDQARAEALRGRIHSFLTRSLRLSAYRMSETQMVRYARALRRFKPLLLIAYPSALESFASFLNASGTEAPTVPSIIVSAETLFPYQRTLFENTFSAEIFNRFGSREVGDIAQECAAHRGLHVNAERVFVEILDDHGVPVFAGREGEVFVTDLDNRGMPFLRYKIGDRASWSDTSTCPCGRGLPLLDGVEGRSMDVIKCPNGNIVGGTFWTILLRERPGIDRFQIAQDRLDYLRIRYVADRDLAADTEAYFRGKIIELTGKDMRIEFSRVPSIGMTSSGKQRLIISALPESHNR